MIVPLKAPPLSRGLPALSNRNSTVGNDTPLGTFMASEPPETGCAIGVAQPEAGAAAILVGVTHTKTCERHAMAVFCAYRTMPIASSENPREANVSVPTKRGTAIAARTPTTAITVTSSARVNPRIARMARALFSGASNDNFDRPKKQG